MIWTLISACTIAEEYTVMFDGPSSISVLSPEENTIFHSPVGFVTNSRSGRIVPIDLQHMGPLSDQSAAPFLRARGVSAGSKRLLSKTIPYQNSANQIKLFAIDANTKQAITIPYLLSENLDIFHSQGSDPELSSDSFSIDNLQFLDGHTTTESWNLRYNGEEWTVQGSRSGNQPNAQFDTPYSSSGNEVSFTLVGSAVAGDTISFSVDTGIQELSLSGTPLDFQKHEQSVFITLYDEENKLGSLIQFDLITESLVKEFILPEGMQPWRISTIFEDNFYISDSQSSRMIRLSLDGTYEEINTPSIVGEMLIVETDDFQHLFLGSAQEPRLDVFNLSTQDYLTINAEDPTQNGLILSAPISGISKNSLEIELQTSNNDGTIKRDEVFLISALNGLTYMVQASDGCLATLPGGAALKDSSSIGVSPVIFNDTGTASNPSFYMNEFNGNMVSMHRCGGVVQNESWNVTFDQIEGDWMVEGSLSGIQTNRAHTNQRYISDRGEISFSIVEGTLSASDGDSFSFETESNALLLNNITNAQGALEPLELPGNSALFQLDDIPYAAIPIHNTDLTVRLQLEDWTVDGWWN